jgi:hypothetical protein
MRTLVYGLFLFIMSIAASDAGAAEPAKKAAGYALLVGCTRYEILNESLQLQGPANDVLMFQDLLVRQFGFSKDSITILSEGRGESARPTRGNIQREFQRLTQAAKPGDQVVILLAGHGSQAPNLDIADSSERGRTPLRKIFLPADVDKWDGAKHQVANAITEEDFHNWLNEIRKSGAFLWVIVDACHSGGMVRGVGEEVVRQVPPDVLIPKEVLDAAQARFAARGDRTRGEATEEPALKFASEERAMVVVYAAQGSEVTVEKTLPDNSTGGKCRGLFSYTLCQVLEQAAHQITYKELIQRVQAKYIEAGRCFPTPLVQGLDRDREVLGTVLWPGRSLILLNKDEEQGLKINAGAIHGLTEGTILGVFPPAGQSRGDKPLGYVRVEDLLTLESRVATCEHEGIATDRDRLPAGGVCEVAVVDYGDMKLSVATDPLDNRMQAIPQEQQQKLTMILENLSSEEGALVRLPSDRRRADWLLRWDGGRIYLIPASGAMTSPSGDLPSLYGPAPDGEQASPWLGRRLTQIARAQNLKRLASSIEESERGENGIRIGLDVRLRSHSRDQKGQSVSTDDRGLTFFDDDRLMLRLSNPNRFPVDVTLLYINGGFGIDTLYPERGEINRLDPGEIVPPLLLKIDGKTSGQEHLVAIVVRGTASQPVDFTALSQPTLEAARGTDGIPGHGPLDSPLGQLLSQAMFASGNTRSASRETLGDCRLEMFSWKVMPGRREK